MKVHKILKVKWKVKIVKVQWYTNIYNNIIFFYKKQWINSMCIEMPVIMTIMITNNTLQNNSNNDES